MSLSSEFDILSPKPIQASFVETSKVTYKPITSVDPSVRDFLIPDNSDTYIDLDIKLYIRGIVTMADLTALDNTDYTAVTDNFCTRSAANVLSP